MKITDVVALPITFDHADGPISYCFVRVETDTGLVGFGEASDGVGCRFAGTLATLVDEALRPLLTGEEPLAVEPLVRKMRGWTRRRLGDQGIVIQAISAVELALWDLFGRSLDLSVSELFGRFRSEVAVCASGPRLERGDPQRHVELLRPCLAAGVQMVKLRMGPDHAADLETLAGVRDLLDPSVGIVVDGDECYTAPTALELAARLAELGVAWFEEPVPQHHRAAVRHVAERSPIPIAAGRHLSTTHDVQALLDDAAVSVLQPDASLGGGLAETRRAALLAEHHGVRIVPRAAAGPVALAANLHLAASVGPVRLLEYPYQLADMWASVAPGAELGPVALQDGCLRVPSGPGLGVELDADGLAAHRYAPLDVVHPMPRRSVGDR